MLLLAILQCGAKLLKRDYFDVAIDSLPLYLANACPPSLETTNSELLIRRKWCRTWSFLVFSGGWHGTAFAQRSALPDLTETFAEIEVWTVHEITASSGIGVYIVALGIDWSWWGSGRWWSTVAVVKIDSSRAKEITKRILCCDNTLT